MCYCFCNGFKSNPKKYYCTQMHELMMYTESEPQSQASLKKGRPDQRRLFCFATTRKTLYIWYIITKARALWSLSIHAASFSLPGLFMCSSGIFWFRATTTNWEKTHETWKLRRECLFLHPNDQKNVRKTRLNFYLQVSYRDASQKWYTIYLQLKYYILCSSTHRRKLKNSI